jgi:putative ABC transport system permease protein
MRFRDLLALIFANLKRMKGRVIMTALGVVIGTAAVMVLVSLGAGLQRQATESFASGGSLNDLRVQGPPMYGDGPMGMGGEVRMAGGGGGGEDRRRDQLVLNDETLDAFRGIPGVELVTPLESMWMGGELQLGKLRGWGQIIGVEQEFAQTLETVSGTANLFRGQIVAGARVASNFYDPEDMMGMGPYGQYTPPEPPELQDARISMRLMRYSETDGTMAEKLIRMEVAGVLKASGWRNDYTIYAPLRDVIEYNSWARGKRHDPGREGYQEVLVRAASSRQALEIEQQILEMGFNVWSERQQLEQTTSFFVIIQAIMGGIGAIALLVAAFGIANTMLMAILERTREIGLMKAIGASNRDVMIVFLGESGGIGVLGGVGGVSLGYALTIILNLIGKSIQLNQGGGYGPTDPAMISNITHTPLWLPIFALIFATLIGLVSGAYPASRAAGLSPIKALKYE